MSWERLTVWRRTYISDSVSVGTQRRSWTEHVVGLDINSVVRVTEERHRCRHILLIANTLGGRQQVTTVTNTWTERQTEITDVVWFDSSSSAALKRWVEARKEHSETDVTKILCMRLEFHFSWRWWRPLNVKLAYAFLSVLQYVASNLQERMRLLVSWGNHLHNLGFSFRRCVLTCYCIVFLVVLLDHFYVPAAG